MRPWMYYLISYSEGYADFILWLNERKVSLIKAITQKAQDGDLVKLQAYSLKLNLYEEIRQKIEAEFREYQSQIDQKQKGGK